MAKPRLLFDGAASELGLLPLESGGIADAESPSGSGAAHDATVAYGFQAEVAAGSGEAGAASLSITTGAGVASGSAGANDADGIVATSAPATVASATGTAHNASAGRYATAGLASGTVTGHDASTTTPAALAFGTVAPGTGTAHRSYAFTRPGTVPPGYGGAGSGAGGSSEYAGVLLPANYGPSPTGYQPGTLGLGVNRMALWERIDGEHYFRCDLPAASDVRWGRRLDQLSTAEATVQLVDLASSTAQMLAAARTKRWWAEITRDPGGRTWFGPVTLLDHGPDTTRIVATDIMWHATIRTLRRRFHRPLAVELTELAADLIAEADRWDDNGLTARTHPTRSITATTLTIEADEHQTVARAIDGLVKLGLGWTAHGDSIVLMAQGGNPSSLEPLGDSHFVGGLRVVEDANEAATWAVEVGDGVSGEAGGIDPYYGLIERRFDARGVTDTDELGVSAARRVARRNPAPLRIEMPQGGRLHPSAPAPIDLLVPGAEVVVSSTATLRRVDQRMRLVEVTVSQRGNAPEQVSVKLEPITDESVAS